MSSMGKRFKKQCDFVHKIADDVIKKRKQTLVRFLFTLFITKTWLMKRKIFKFVKNEKFQWNFFLLFFFLIFA